MLGQSQSLDIPLLAPFRIATGEVTTARNVLYAVEGQGRIGVGEATPFEVITGGTQASVLRDLARLPREFDEGADIGALLTRLAAQRMGPDARNALDVALHDWFAQAAGQPLATYLGGSPRALPSSITLPIVDLKEIPALVRRGLDQGFRIFKVKSKSGLPVEQERIRLVRELAGSEAEIRVDANAGWSLEEAKAMLPHLRKQEVAFLEQPLARSDLEGHAELVRVGALPIMLDESIFTLADAERALAARACDLINVKLAKSGGILEASRILRFAASRGVACMIGCMIESRIAISAGAHVAAAFPAVRYVDLDGHTFLARDPVEGGVRLRRGRLEFPDAAGHGARLAAPTARARAD